VSLVKKLINDPHAVVPEMLAGLVARTPGLAFIDGQTVVVREDIATVREREVALISGGGSGHEPAHAGYVGSGMLHAAVAGEVFTSPSVDAVLAAIRAVCGPPGVLLIVKNYTGDRLNFGLAAEIARSEGRAVEMVLVADDVAIPDAGDARRGIAGTVFVHKIAGALAARGAALGDVVAAARATANAIGTMGVALGSAIVPAAGTPGFTLGEREVELGLGIHGEPGVMRTELTGARELTARLLATIIDDKRIVGGDRVAVLVNDLGGTPPMELDIVSAMTVELLTERGIVVERLWTGRFLTSLEMPGVSLTLLPVDDARLALLDAPVGAGAWPSASRHGVRLDRARIAAAALPPQAEAAAAALAPGSRPAPAALRRALDAVATALLAAEGSLTELDGAVGDGDLGSSLARAAGAIRTQAAGDAARDSARVLAALAADVRRIVGGTSGPLYAAFLLRAAHALANAKALDPDTWARAFLAGCDALRELGGASIGDCTMLDALQPAADAFAAGLAGNADWGEALTAAVGAARAGAAATQTMLPKRGRARYLGERALGHVDPGAVAVTIWLDAIAQTLHGNSTPARM